MKKILCICIGMLFILSCDCGCEGEQEKEKKFTPLISQEEIHKTVLYYKDERTNVCFVRVKDSRMVINCTPEVEKVIYGR